MTTPSLTLSGLLAFMLYLSGPQQEARAQDDAGPGLPEGYIAQGIEAIGYLDIDPVLKLALQEVDGRWYLYSGHSWKQAWVVIDVTEPSEPKVVNTIDGPPNTRTNQVELHDGILFTSMMRPIIKAWGDPEGEFEEGYFVWDTSDPVNPKLMNHFRTGGNGIHRLGYYGGPFVHAPAFNMPGWTGEPISPKYPNLRMNPIYLIIDWKNNKEVGRWWVPGQRDGEEWDPAHLHGPPYIRDDLAYLPYGPAGLVILDVSDQTSPKFLGRLDLSPPFTGALGLHTALPLPGRDIVYVSTEAFAEMCAGPLSFAGLVDASDPTRPYLISILPLPVPPPGAPYRDFCEKGGRFGPHNTNMHLHHKDVQQTGNLLYVTYFTAGLRVFDISNPRLPREVAYFIPPEPRKKYGHRMDGKFSSHTEDVLVDRRGFAYLSHANQGIWIVRLIEED